jgi:hypothetical protein
MRHAPTSFQRRAKALSRNQSIRRLHTQRRSRRRPQRRKRTRSVQVLPDIPQHIDRPPALRSLHFNLLQQHLNRIESIIGIFTIPESGRLLKLHLQDNGVAGDEVLRLVPADELRVRAQAGDD